MKSFSPAGAATKAYYGLGARTFGNPDGATRGGGAYAAGGANPNGPNQGGGAAPAANLIIRADAGAALRDVAAGGAPADQILGDFSTLIGLVPDLYFILAESGPDMVMTGFCGIPQFGFTNIQMLDFGVGFDSATAVFAPGCGTSQWTWVGRAVVLLPLTVYSMIVT